MVALTANRTVDRYPDQELRSREVAASAHIFTGANVGLSVDGYAGPLVVPDVFYGLSYEEIDNSGGSAGDKNVRVFVEGDFELTVTGATRADIGKAVYATDDATYALSGHPDCFVGRITDWVATDTVVVKLKGAHDQLTEKDTGSIEIVHDFAKPVTPTGAVAGPITTGGLRLNSALGLGVLSVSAANGGLDMTFDAVAEIALASVETLGIFTASKGVKFEGRLHLPDIGDDAALDVDWGLGTELTANSRASIDHDDMVNLAAFHMDGNVANILAQSDNDTIDVASVDTTIDNDVTAGAYKDFVIIVRPSGSVEFYIDGARVLAATVFAVDPTAVLAAFVNMEKTSNNTLGQVRIDRLRITGART